MLYGIFGNNDEKKQKFLQEHREKNYKDVPFLVRDEQDFSLDEFQNEIVGEHLFGEKHGFILKNIVPSFGKEIITLLQDIQPTVPVYLVDIDMGGSESLFLKENIFIFKNDAEVPDFTLYSAIYFGSKKDIWLAYTNKSKNEPFELIHAGILSQVKNMYIAKQFEGEYKELGFSTDKSLSSSKKGAAKYTLPELKELYGELVLLPMKSRVAGIPGEITLEKILITYMK